MDVLGHLTEFMGTLPTNFHRLPTNVIAAALNIREKAASAFENARPMLEFSASSTAGSPPLRSRIVADMRRSPILWMAIAYQVTCVVYSLIFGIIILATARIFVLTILLYARYLAQENTKLKTFEASNMDLQQTNANLNQVVEALGPLLQQASGTAENNKVTAENLAPLVSVLQEFQKTIDGNNELFKQVQQNQQILSTTQGQLSEATRQLNLTRDALAKQTAKLATQVDTSGKTLEALARLVKQLLSLTTPLEDEEICNRIKTALLGTPTITTPSDSLQDIPVQS